MGLGHSAAGAFSGYPPVLTVRLGVIQRYIPRAIRLSFSRSGDEAGVQGDVSQFGLLMTALAATIGTGNIIGSRE
jgi:AGCS family alanine or glycine:cation symporter